MVADIERVWEDLSSLPFKFKSFDLQNDLQYTFYDTEFTRDFGQYRIGDKVDMIDLELDRGWLKCHGTEEFIPTSFSVRLEVEHIKQGELSDDRVKYIVDAWARGFNPCHEELGALARDLLRARGYDSVLCSRCGSNILLPESEHHHCDRSKMS